MNPAFQFLLIKYIVIHTDDYKRIVVLGCTVIRR